MKQIKGGEGMSVYKMESYRTKHHKSKNNKWLVWKLINVLRAKKLIQSIESPRYHAKTHLTSNGRACETWQSTSFLASVILYTNHKTYINHKAWGAAPRCTWSVTTKTTLGHFSKCLTFLSYIYEEKCASMFN